MRLNPHLTSSSANPDGIVSMKNLYLAALAMAASALTACLQANEEPLSGAGDGQSAFIVAEIDEMGRSLQDLPMAAAGKAGAADTLTGELIIHRYGYREECQCFIRTAEYSGSRGYERTRVDSVTLVDSNGAILTAWSREGIAKVVHKRHVTHHKGAHEIDVRFQTEATFKHDGGYWVGVWNGTMTGSLDGEEFKSGTVTQITRTYENGQFLFPESGMVTLTRPLRHYSVEFLGGGDAKAVITHRRTGKVTLITIDRNYAEAPSP